MNVNEKTSQKIQELQMLEQNFQMFLHQKQAIQVELNELTNAEQEVQKTEGPVYKVLSGIMMKSEKPTVLKDLQDKKAKAELQMSSLEKQEKSLDSKIQELKKEITSSVSEEKK